MNTTAPRRLAAILAADVAGYSRLMGADEEGTHERLKAHLREVVEPQICDHHGRIVKTPATAYWRNSSASSMPRDAQPTSSRQWPTASWISPKSAACDFASASISATSSPMRATFTATASTSRRG